MPPKASKAGKGGKDSQGPQAPAITIQDYADVLKGEKILNEAKGNRPVKRVEAVMNLWSHALAGEPQREEIFKTSCIPQLISLLERGQEDERHGACGAICALAQSEKHITEIINHRVINAAVSLLSGEHDRSRQPAAQLLALLAQRLEYSSRVADLALAALLAGCTPGLVPGWGGARATAMHCVRALRALIENVQGELSAPKVARRMALIQMGAVPAMIELVAYVPRLPPPLKVPATPPAALGKKAGGSSKGKSKGKGKGKSDGRPPAGRKDMTATHAAACLRFLALCPAFLEQLLESGCLPKLIAALLTASDEQAAYICGILWEITADIHVAKQVIETGGVRALLHTIAVNLSATKGRSKAKKKPKEGSSEPKKSEKAVAAPPPSYPDIAVCNAAGTLHHLTFLDDAKLQICKFGGAVILAACLKAANTQTFENATGALWNCGLDAANSAVLAASGVPSYLSKPVPEHWILASEAEAVHDGGDTSQGPSFFMTQADV